MGFSTTWAQRKKVSPLPKHSFPHAFQILALWLCGPVYLRAIHLHFFKHIWWQFVSFLLLTLQRCPVGLGNTSLVKELEFILHVLGMSHFSHLINLNSHYYAQATTSLQLLLSYWGLLKDGLLPCHSHRKIRFTSGILSLEMHMQDVGIEF